MYNRIMEVLACRSDKFSKEVSYLLNSQKNRIEDLYKITEQQTNRIDQLFTMYTNLSYDVENREAKAIKEFVKKLKENMRLEDNCNYDCENCYYACRDWILGIDKLVKETIGE